MSYPTIFHKITLETLDKKLDTDTEIKIRNNVIFHKIFIINDQYCKKERLMSI